MGEMIMKYDHIIKSAEELKDACFHLSCGFYETTTFLFEKANFAVFIHNKGTFTFYTVDGQKIETVKAKPMESGRGCYMDVLITTTEEGVHFKLPDYQWIDHYPHCDGESDRWSTRIIGTNDEIFYRALP